MSTKKKKSATKAKGTRIAPRGVAGTALALREKDSNDALVRLALLLVKLERDAGRFVEVRSYDSTARAYKATWVNPAFVVFMEPVTVQGASEETHATDQPQPAVLWRVGLREGHQLYLTRESGNALRASP